MAVKRVCSIPGCGKPHHSAEYCGMHYARFKSNGDPLVTKRREACAVPDCSEKHFGLGFCTTHYRRFKKYGDPLFAPERKPVIKKTKTYFRDVVLPFTGEDCLEWPFSLDKDGYGKFGSDRAHRVICLSVHGEPPSKEYEAAHSCGNAACVNWRHLRWATRSENRQDKLMHGTDNRGEKHSLCKLTEGQVREIIGLKGKVSLNAAAKMYGVSFAHISSIQRRRSWAWLEV